jgi:hypothetical protein
MIIPDVNILIHAYNDDFVNHEAARAWWEDTLRLSRPDRHTVGNHHWIHPGLDKSFHLCAAIAGARGN